MKVLHISAADGGGGAARATYRIHRSLRAHGHGAWKSEMLVARKVSMDDSVHLLEKNSVVRFAVSATRRVLDQEVLLSRTQNSVFRSPARLPTAAIRRIADIRPDIVLLHWLGSRMLSVEQIGQLASNSVPVAWVLHDAWTFCGAEHYPNGETDRRFAEGYRRLFRPGGDIGLDVNRLAWERKKSHWTRPIHLVAPSRWMASMASESALVADWPLSVIPNPIDVDWWGRLSRLEARRSLGLDLDAPILIFGAIGGDADPRKGAALLYEALGCLPSHHRMRPTRPIQIFTFGGKPGVNQLGPHTVRSVGILNDEGLRKFYTAADVMVVPSRIDNLPQTAVEATACGTPVVAFRTGGLPDIVDDRVTGRLAEPFDPASLADSIAWVLESLKRHSSLSAAARRSAVRWEPGRIASSYTELFEEMLGR